MKKVNRHIRLIAFFILLISWESYAQKQVVLIKVYNQTLEPFRNEELSFNGGPFIRVDKNGQLFMEFNAQDLPPKTVKLKNAVFEVATWSHSNGKLEIVVRAKTSQMLHLSVYDEKDKLVTNVRVRYQKKFESVTDINGSLELNIPLNSLIQADQFEIDGYQTISLESIKDGKYILHAKLIPSPRLEADSAPTSIAKQSKSKNADLSKLDSIKSFSELYNLFSQLELKKIDERVQQRINEKFRELLSRSENSQTKLPIYARTITDSSQISDDMMNLLLKAQSDRELIRAQRKEFDQNAQTIQNKLSAGIENLSDAEKEALIKELGDLEKILMENEQFFSENNEYYLTLLSTMKEKFFDISVLEDKLTASEAKRLEEQKQFRKRIILISSLVFLFAILLVLLLRSERRLRKVNTRISEMNENLESIVMQRTRMLMLANKELDTFLYRASHDLRSPVCSIIGLCNIATHIANPESLDLLQKVTGTVQIMDKLLKKLSVISEINEPSGFGEVHVKDLIVNTLKSFEDSIKENKVSVIIQCEDGLSFYSYPNLLDVVLSNIIENALFYSLIKDTVNAEIKIAARTHENKVQITITDNGIGIDNGIKSRLFDMFFKGNENSKGNGLGLYIVLKSIKALKGEVEVESQPGHYSKFIVTLPTHIEARSSSVKELEGVISQ